MTPHRKRDPYLEVDGTWGCAVYLIAMPFLIWLLW